MTAMMGYDITDGVLDTKFNILLVWKDERNRSELLSINFIFNLINLKSNFS